MNDPLENVTVHVTRSHIVGPHRARVRCLEVRHFRRLEDAYAALDVFTRRARAKTPPPV